ncbi:hypothetical protein A3H84_03595 [Candidatus Roizmanbacteria bacterium RIFCSPLOWO2_02_FULL_40_13]|nr:MAG: hypothetical protein A3H84_03595 [Candidatus Roizmanbacteria bacterium RIFCSPLOWO2_02_FULL_40_13]
MRSIKDELKSLQNNPHIDNKYLLLLLKRIEKNKKLLKQEGVHDHFSSLFVPANIQKRKIFLVHHKKAGSWIPPGGHIELGETPVQTVKREFHEELGFTLTNEKIQLFSASTYVLKKDPFCKIHYDIWYLVYMDKITTFRLDKREFYDGSWIDFKDIVKKVKTKEFKPILKQIALLK